MAVGVSTHAGRRGVERRTLGAALRSVGRVALWTLVALLLAKGGSAVLAGPPKRVAGSAPRGAAEEPATSAFAVRFARAYLSGASRRSWLRCWRRAPAVPRPGATGAGVPVEQAEVARHPRPRRRAGDRHGRLRARRRPHPLSRRPDRPRRRGRGGGAGSARGRRRPGRGRGRASRRPGPSPARTRRRSPSWCGASCPPTCRRASPATSPTSWRPERRWRRPAAACGSSPSRAVKQVGSGEGARRTVIATARVRDPPSGAIFPLAYRLEVVRHGRWYVERVEGALS